MTSQITKDFQMKSKLRKLADGGSPNPSMLGTGAAARAGGLLSGRGRQIEGAEVAGKRVVIVEDTSTTGGSPLKAAQVAKDAGADVVAVVTVVDRKTGAQAAVEAAGFEWRSIIDLDDLGLEAQ